MTESLLDQMKRRAQEMGLEFEAPHASKIATEGMTFEDDLIPVLPRTNRPKEFEELDAFVGSIDIIDAYERWCGKMSPKVGKRRESIMISCPNPSHPDKVPSAWINLDKQTWFCGGCQEGGDVFDIAAWHFGYPVPGYKDRMYFPSLMADMAGDYGYQVMSVPGGSSIVIAAEENEAPATSGVQGDGGSNSSSIGDGEGPASEDDESIADVIALPTSDTYEHFKLPEEIDPIPWHLIAEPDSFLDIWMRCCQQSYVPEDYFFWHGMMAVGLALGRDVQLKDETPVKGNLFTVLVGASGAGKSRSVGALNRLLREALPHDPDDPRTTGIKHIMSPGSAEALVDAMCCPIYEEDDEGKLVCTGEAPVRGFLRVDEFALLASRASRLGSGLKQILMEFYDGENSVSVASRGAGTKEAVDPYMSMVSTTQWDSLSTVLDRGDLASGFVNRWLFIPGYPKKRRAFNTNVLDIAPAVQPLQRIRTWASGLGTRYVTMDPDAEEMFNDYYEDHIQQFELNDENVILARLNLHLKKVMLLLAANEGKWIIDPIIVDRTIMIGDYLIGIFKRTDAKVVEYEQDVLIDKILERIADRNRHGGLPTARDIQRAVGARHKREDVAKALEVMMKLGMIEAVMDRKPGRGRPTMRYQAALDDDEV